MEEEEAPPCKYNTLHRHAEKALHCAGLASLLLPEPAGQIDGGRCGNGD